MQRYYYLEIPWDIWVEIFGWVLYSGPGSSTYDITLYRKNLRNVCKFWSTIVCYTPALWMHVLIGRGSASSSRSQFSRSGQLPLTVGVHLDVQDENVREGWELLLHSLHRCRVLAVKTFGSQGLDALNHGLKRASCRGLRDVILCSGRFPWAEEEHSRGAFVAVTNQFADLLSLRIHKLSLEWDRRPALSHLQTLSMIDVVYEATWTDLRYLANTAGNLQRLSLRNFAFNLASGDRQDPIIFPSVVELDIAFVYIPSMMGRLLQNCCTPNLRSLSFQGHHRGDAATLSTSTSILASVRHLRLTPALPDEFSLLFIQLHRLETLEIHGWDRLVLEGVLGADQKLSTQIPSAGRACPELVDVRSHQASAQDMLQFIIKRVYGVRTVGFTGGETQWNGYTKELGNLQSQVVVVHNEAYPAPAWTWLEIL
ncbi:hypothetical protein B0H16DRAFT_1768441 [Mycena metata]|uniref:Uncharacterized protein n=1 Tax=Mycena metata TaxID=1033252 RepID=A0AAD7MWC1_9AGAR|nr:hypothetical protein B0H16DRAFT_1768441 [Mycena metata]